MTSLADKKRILIIESYHSEYPWDASYLQGIREILGNNVQYSNFQMDTKRLPRHVYPERADMAWHKYLKVKPHLVILGDDNALQLLCPRFIQTDTPVVYLGINNNPRFYNATNVKNITGVLERPLLRRSVLFLRDILEQTPKKVLILLDSGTTSRVVAEEFKEYKTRKLSNVRVDYRLIGQYGEWKKSVLNLKKNGYDALIIGLYHTIVDDKQNHVKADTIIQWTSDHTPVPIFCFWDFAVGPNKAVGGYVLFGKTMGRMAGKMAREILAGKSPRDIKPVFNNEGRFYFSRTQLKKWGLTLPEKIRRKAEFID